MLRVTAMWLVTALLLLEPLRALANTSPDVVARARSRAEGNDVARAVALGEALLAKLWSAQLLKIRVDSIGNHHVAGIMLSGTKFHGRLDQDAFLREVRELVVATLGDVSLEEVDIWAVVPVAVSKGALVSGPLGEPTTRTVFSATVRRRELDHLDTFLRSKDVYWEVTWRSTLRGADGVD